MQSKNLKNWIELLIMAAMLFGLVAMLSAGFRADGSEVSRLNPLRYGFQILLVAALALVFISRRRMLIERIALGMVIFGMFSLCQPFTMVLYRCGFQTLLSGTLAFIVVSHMSRETERETLED